MAKKLSGREARARARDVQITTRDGMPGCFDSSIPASII